MNFVSNEELRKIINESVNNVLKEAGAPVPVGGRAPRPVGGGAPVPVGGGAPRPVGGGAPRPVGGGAPAPVGGGAPRPVGGGAPRPVGGGAPAPVGGGAPSVASGAQSNVSQDADADEVKGGVDKNGKHKPGILTARYEPFYETKDPSQTDQQVFKMWLTYINQQACNRFVTFLNQNYGDIVFSPLPLHDPTCRIPKNLKKGDGSAVESGFNQYWVKIVIRPGKKDEFIQKVPEIVDGLYAIFDELFSPSKPRRGRPFQGNPGKIAYDDSYKPKFAQYIIDFVNKTPSPEEVQSVEIKIAQNLKELLAHLNDPQVQQRIGMLRMIVSSPTRKQLQNFLQNHSLQDQNGVLSGWLLSQRNAMRVLAQNPNATYIAQEHIWRAWGHEIIDPNDFVLVNMPTTWKTFDEKAFDRACKEMGFTGGANEYRYKKKNGLINLAGQQKAALDHFENLYNPGKTNFGLYKFYDVSNTKVIPGLVSKFLPGAEQEPGLSNNLQGAVNTAAGGDEVFQAANAQPSADTDDENGLPMTSPEEVKMFKDALQAITVNETGSAPSGLGTSDEHDIVLLAYHYADFLQRSQYKSMIPETAELFKKGFAAGIATSIGIKDTEGANYLSTALSSTGKDTKIEQLAAKWFQDYLDLLIDIQKEIDAKASKMGGKKTYKKVVEEDALNESFGIKTLNFDEFKKLLHIDELEGYNAQDDLMSNQQLKESFFSFLDRMDGEYEQ